MITYHLEQMIHKNNNNDDIEKAVMARPHQREFARHGYRSVQK